MQGRLIEVLTGKSFGEVMAERLFEPLGMADTGFSVPAGKVIRHLDVRKGAYERAQRCILNLVRV